LSEKTGRYSHFIIPGFDSPINFAGARAPNRSSYQEIDPNLNHRSNLPTLSPITPDDESPRVTPISYQDYPTINQ
jgi:hypothetical protein